MPIRLFFMIFDDYKQKKIAYFSGEKKLSEENIFQRGTAALRSHCAVTNVTGEKPHVYLKQTELNNNSEKCENISEKYENISDKYENISEKYENIS